MFVCMGAYRSGFTAGKNKINKWRRAGREEDSGENELRGRADRTKDKEGVDV